LPMCGGICALEGHELGLLEPEPATRHTPEAHELTELTSKLSPATTMAYSAPAHYYCEIESSYNGITRPLKSLLNANDATPLQLKD
jgi:hypothetical protein